MLHKGHVVLPKDPRVSALIPHAKTIQYNGGEYVLVPHALDETKVLRNLGIDAPPPILSQYDWGASKPFDAQRITAAHITQNPLCFVLNEMGTGKTRAALYAYDYLRKIGKANRLLVLAPLSTLRQTWLREITLFFPHLRGRVLHKGHWDTSRKVAELSEPAEVYIINHDSGKLLWKQLADRSDIDMVVVDELTTYKNTQSDMWKLTNKAIKDKPRRVGMTGSPIPKDPTDAYGQVKLIDPTRAGRSYVDFRDHVMRKVSAFRWLPKQDAVARVHQFMQPGVRFLRDECFDLPPCQFVNHEVQLTHDQERIYKAMMSECAVELQSGNLKAVNEADRRNKLVQICTGFAYDTERQVQQFDVSHRLRALDEFIAGSASKVIVFTPYKASLRLLCEHVGKNWTYAEVSGDVSPSQRERIFTEFRGSPDPRVLVAHPECMSHGLTLTEASTIVWYGPPPSLEFYQQANARITRPGQRHSQLIAKLVASPIERAIYRRYDAGAELQDLLLELFAEQESLGDL